MTAEPEPKKKKAHWVLPKGGTPHVLTKEEMARGGASKSIQKSISAKLRKYNDPNLNCTNCKTRCLLYKPGDTGPCAKSIWMQDQLRLATCKDPEPLFNAYAEKLMDLNMEAEIKLDKKHDPLGKESNLRKDRYLGRLMDFYKMRFGTTTNVKLEGKPFSANDFQALYAKAKEVEAEIIEDEKV